MKRMKLIVLAMSTLAVLAGAQAPVANADDSYLWCYHRVDPYGRTLYVSAVFRDNGDYHVGISNQFDNHVAAHYNPSHSSGARCMGPYDRRSEAEQTLNRTIADGRRDGVNVVITHWRYRGD
jgi:hypothetical protein